MGLLSSGEARVFSVAALQRSTGGWLMLAWLNFMPINSDRQLKAAAAVGPSVIAGTTAG